jgi:hypothetical protein
MNEPNGAAVLTSPANKELVGVQENRERAFL